MIVAEDKFEMFGTRCWGMRRPEPTLATIEARRHFVTALERTVSDVQSRVGPRTHVLLASFRIA